MEENAKKKKNIYMYVSTSGEWTMGNYYKQWYYLVSLQSSMLRIKAKQAICHSWCGNEAYSERVEVKHRASEGHKDFERWSNLVHYEWPISKILPHIHA